MSAIGSEKPLLSEKDRARLKAVGEQLQSGISPYAEIADRKSEALGRSISLKVRKPSKKILERKWKEGTEDRAATRKHSTYRVGDYPLSPFKGLVEGEADNPSEVRCTFCKRVTSHIEGTFCKIPKKVRVQEVVDDQIVEKIIHTSGNVTACPRCASLLPGHVSSVSATWKNRQVFPSLE